MNLGKAKIFERYFTDIIRTIPQRRRLKKKKKNDGGWFGKKEGLRRPGTQGALRDSHADERIRSALYTPRRCKHPGMYGQLGRVKRELKDVGV